MRALFLLVLAFSFVVPLSSAQDRRFSVELNLSGAFLDVAGNLLTDPTVDDLAVNRWYPGLNLGYRWRERLEVTYSFYAPLKLALTEDWRFWGPLNDGRIVVDHQPKSVHVVATRFYPFRKGLYAAAGLMHLGRVDYQMTFRRLGETFLMGNNEYPFDVDLHWNTRSMLNLGIGLGYAQSFRSGLGFHIGVMAPITFPTIEEVAFIYVNAAPTDFIEELDARLGVETLMNETFYAPVVLQLSVRYQFAIPK